MPAFYEESRAFPEFPQQTSACISLSHGHCQLDWSLEKQEAGVSRLA